MSFGKVAKKCLLGGVQQPQHRTRANRTRLFVIDEDLGYFCAAWYWTFFVERKVILASVSSPIHLTIKTLHWIEALQNNYYKIIVLLWLELWLANENCHLESLEGGWRRWRETIYLTHQGTQTRSEKLSEFVLTCISIPQCRTLKSERRPTFPLAPTFVATTSFFFFFRFIRSFLLVKPRFIHSWWNYKFSSELEWF